MPNTIACLLEARHAGTSNATVFTASAKTIIDKCTATNTTPAADVTLAVHIVPNGGTRSSANRTMFVTIEAGKCYLCGELVGHILEQGDAIHFIAGQASAISVRASGRVAQ